MKEFSINTIFSGIATALIFVFGQIDIALIVLLIAIALDYFTGIAKAYITGELNSHAGLKGIVKKIGYLALVAVAVIIDRVTGQTGAIRTLVMYYFVANECLSIIENCGKMGLPIPKVLVDKLEQLKEENK